MPVSSERGKFGRIYIAALLLAVHSASTVYINSTFLSQFFPEKLLSFFYIAGSLLTLLILASCARLVRRFGNYRLMLVGIMIEIVALFGLALGQTHAAIAISFVLLQALPGFLFFNLDVFLERATRGEGNTGKIRSTYLTIINSAYVLSPVIIGGVITRGGYATVYAIAAIVMTIVFLVVFDAFDPNISHASRETSFRDSVRKLAIRPRLAPIYFINFLLQSFYALMVIYTPLYLHNIVGIGWQTIGLMFTIMLIPFVVFEAPLGRIFDKHRGERDALIAGFLMMGTATLCMFYLHSSNAFLWGSLLFLSRIGASFVEVGSEYSFFRQVDGRDAGLISVFRTAAPASFVIAPLIGLIITAKFPLQHIFLAASLATFLGAFVSYNLHRAK